MLFIHMMRGLTGLSAAPYFRMTISLRGPSMRPLPQPRRGTTFRAMPMPPRADLYGATPPMQIAIARHRAIMGGRRRAEPQRASRLHFGYHFTTTTRTEIIATAQPPRTIIPFRFSLRRHLRLHERKIFLLISRFSAARPRCRARPSSLPHGENTHMTGTRAATPSRAGYSSMLSPRYKILGLGGDAACIITPVTNRLGDADASSPLDFAVAARRLRITILPMSPR